MTLPQEGTFQFGDLLLIRWYAQPPPRTQQIPTLFAMVHLRRVASSDRTQRLLELAETLGLPWQQTVTSQIASSERIASALALVERELETGGLLAFRRPAPVFRTPGAIPDSTQTGTLAAQQSPPIDESRPAQTWIEICLVGEDGSPVGGEPCRLRLPDGQVITARTDAAGILRVDDLPAGSCEVCFEALDESAWEPAPRAP
jgi:hypothetical protein